MWYIAIVQTHSAMGWLRLVDSLTSKVSFAEYRLFYRALLQKRPIIWRSLLIVATPYESGLWLHITCRDGSSSCHELCHLNITNSIIWISPTVPSKLMSFRWYLVMSRWLIFICHTHTHTLSCHTHRVEPRLKGCRVHERGGGLGSRPKKMYGERLWDGVEYHLMCSTPRR